MASPAAGRSPATLCARAIASQPNAMSKSPIPCSSHSATHRRACHSAGSGPAQDRVDAGALPLPAGEVHRLPDLAPMVARGVGGVQHLVVLHRRSVGRLEQRPDVIEQVDGDLSLGDRVQRRRRRDGCLGHDRFLVVDGSVQPMDLPLSPGQERGQPRSMGDEQALSLHGVGADHGTDLGQREVQLAKASDQSGVLELRSCVRAVRRLRIDPCRDEQVELVIVAQRTDAQAGQAGESPDRQQLVHDAQHGACGRSRVNPAAAVREAGSAPEVRLADRSVAARTTPRRATRRA